MTRRPRQLLFAATIGSMWLLFVRFAWRMLTTFDRFVVTPWLSPRSSAIETSGPAATPWSPHPMVIVALLVVAGLLAFFAWRIWQWFVRNSALKERCDGCGYLLPAETESYRCPECGAESEFVTNPNAISSASWRRLLVAAVLGSLGVAGLLVAELLLAIPWLHDPAGGGMARLNPADWLGTAIWTSLFAFLIGAFAFMIWLYLEPSKHPQPRDQRLKRRCLTAR